MIINNYRYLVREFPQIKHVFFDFDGVFTPNTVAVNERGEETALCNRADGIGLQKLLKTQMSFSIISSEKNPIVRERAKKLAIPVDFGVTNKLEFARVKMTGSDISMDHVAFMGNDDNDLELLKAVALSICPADSWPSVMETCDLVTQRQGGGGCVRELCDALYEIRRIK